MEEMMKKNYKSLVNKIAYIAAIGVSVGVLFFVIGCTWIGYEAKNLCEEAQLKFPGNCTQALTGMLNDTTQSYRKRNDAIWALGQWGDPAALPALQSYWTGVIPAREPINQMISQYELKKAIALCSGGTNLSAFIWRGSFR
jgi:hypothetical protein